jgi:hypothetical protein
MVSSLIPESMLDLDFQEIIAKKKYRQDILTVFLYMRENIYSDTISKGISTSTFLCNLTVAE